MYARGAFGAKGLSVESLWSSIWGPPLFSQTMSRNRFSEIQRFLRFDLKVTRSQRLEDDKFALASEVWNRFIANSIMCYKPGPNITVDEQLFPTKARCRWTQYMPAKPDKFGIKFWLAADVESKYLVNGFPYLGKDETRPLNQSLGESVVLRLMEPYIGKGRNVTTDRFFTSVSLVKKLQEKSTSLLGTVNQSRRELPPIAKTANKPLYSTALLKNSSNGSILTIYQCKPKRNVLLLSSLHSSVSIGNSEKKVPETIDFYNVTKYGVDVLDQMARKYSVKAGSRRWPVQVFYNILDLAAINSWILYKASTGKRISRRCFILQLVEELRQPFSSRKNPVPQLEGNFGFGTSSTGMRKKCQVGNCSGNKTSNMCAGCRKAVCGSCTAEIQKRSICIECAETEAP